MSVPREAGRERARGQVSAVSVTRHRGRLTPEDRAESSWAYLPVEVPPGCDGLEVTLDHERIGAVLDLGCLDPDGWRGWSGGSRSRFVIRLDEATPGYLPGELPAGTWQVVLGLHRVPDHGVGYEVTVRTGRTAPLPVVARPPVAERRPRRELPALPGLTWLAGDLHAHTVHSDGSLTIDELAALAVDRGLDFCAVTDHNTVSHHPHLAAASSRAGVTLVPGQEVTTESGHANAFGAIGWVDFREPTDSWLDAVGERGGLLSVNHPIGGDCSWRRTHTGAIPLAEVWHGSWSHRREGGTLAWWAARGYGPIPVGGSDWHYPGDGPVLGAPTTWVACEDETTGAVLAGLAAGRTAITADRDGPAVLRLGDELVVVDGEGSVLLAADGRRRLVDAPRWSIPAPDGPVVLETGDRVALALTA